MKLEFYAPPGYNWQRELAGIRTGLSVAVLYSLVMFLMRYKNTLSRLYRSEGSIKVLNERAIMADFHVVVSGSFIVFPMIVLSMIAVIALRYAYHYQGSKSIYLMRRLPSRWELHRRCIIIPLTVILISLLLVSLLLLIYYGVYMTQTPTICLPPNQWVKLWEAIRGIIR